MKVFGSIRELVNVVFRKNSQEITVRPNQSTTYTANRDIQLPPLDADEVILGDSASQTISNKTLDNSNIYTIQDANITFQDDGDNTKAFKFDVAGVTTATTRILNIPNANTTLVGTDALQTLTNKTINSSTINIDDNNLTLQDNGDNTKQARFELSGITTATLRAYTLPDANTTVVGTDTSQILSNKTIDGDVNTISNLAHGAEVDNPSSGVHGVTGSVVGTSDSQTLTNKTLTSPIVGTDAIFDDAAILKFKGTTDEDYLGFKAPADVTATVTFTLPDGDGTSNQVLQTNGSGQLGWASVSAAEDIGHTLSTVSSAGQTISSTDCLWAPFATISTGHTFTVSSGAFFTSAGDVTVDGTLIISSGGTSLIL